MRSVTEALRAWGGWALLGVLAAALLFFFLSLFPLRPAHAFDHGFDHNDPLVRWFDDLTRDAPLGVVKCCGRGDAYAIAIDIDGTDRSAYQAIAPPCPEDWVAHITDGRAIEWPDGTKREPIPDGTFFRFSGDRLTRERSGNPTKTAWAFLNVMGGGITGVWCVVRLLPSM